MCKITVVPTGPETETINCTYSSKEISYVVCKGNSSCDRKISEDTIIKEKVDMQDERQRLHHASKREFEVITNMQRKPRIQNFG